jgi:hypothetical protein
VAAGRFFSLGVIGLKHIIAILFILIDILVFAGLSWVIGHFSAPSTATPDPAQNIEVVIATPTLPAASEFFFDNRTMP